MNDLYLIYETSDDELYHYGVLGMKWGVKKNRSEHYHKRSDTSLVKAGKAKSRFLKKWHKDRSIDFDEMAETSKLMTGQKGIKRLRTQFGYGRESRRYAARSEKNRFRAAIARTRLGSDFSKQLSANQKELSKVFEKAHNEKGALNKFIKKLAGVYWDRPYHQLSGKTTSMGEELVKGYLSSMIPLVGPAIYGVGSAVNYFRNRDKYSSDERLKKKYEKIDKDYAKEFPGMYHPQSEEQKDNLASNYYNNYNHSYLEDSWTEESKNKYRTKTTQNKKRRKK